MDNDTLTYILYTIIAILLVYVYLIPNHPDVAPMLLANQSSIAPIRKPGQTAIYRSPVTSHGKSLVSGLDIETESEYKYTKTTRAGHIGDLWELAKKCRFEVASMKDGSYWNKHMTSDHLQRLVYTLSKTFGNWCSNEKSVVILLPNCTEAMACLWASTLFKIKVVIIPYKGLTEFQMNQAVEKANPGVIATTSNLIEQLNIKNVPFISCDNQKVESKKVYTWEELVSDSKELKSYPELPSHKEDDALITIAYIGFDDHMQEITYTNRNICAAVAAQIKSLPKKDQWTSDDTVLSCSSSITAYSIVLSLVAIVQQTKKLVFPLAVDRSLIQLISQLEPTIVISDDRNSLEFLEIVKSLGVGRYIRHHVGIANLSRGNVTNLSAMSQFKTVRLIYSAHDSLEFKGISNEQANEIRALTGSKLIHSFTSPVCAGAIAQTHPCDYRLGESIYINYGIPLPCVEIILKDHGPYDSSNKKGQIWVRGYSLPTNDEWANTGTIGIFGDDDALKLYY